MSSVTSTPETSDEIVDAGAPLAEPEPGTDPVAPVAARERIGALDVARGVAVLGILLMNIVDFGLPSVSYDNPSAAGGNTWPNLAYWYLSHILFEGKMRGLFSILFGAGVILLTSRAEARGGQAQIADIYYRRTLWLLAFGLIHAYFFWEGDILFDYAVVGLMLYPFRHLSPWTLLILGVLLMGTTLPRAWFDKRHMEGVRDRGVAIESLVRAGTPLNEEQTEAKREWDELSKSLKPDPKRIQKAIKEHQAGYWTLFFARAKRVASGQPKGFYTWGLFDSGSFMLIGMALMKLGILSGARSARTYQGMMLLGYGIGIPLNVYTGYRCLASGFDPFVKHTWQYIPYQPERLLVDLGHIGLIMTLLRLGVLPALMRRLEAAGRMALSNYLGTTFICCLVFNGYGLGLYGRLERYQLLGVLAGVWVVILTVSPIWLRHFRYGPMEWVWRSLTYWQRQPLRLGAPSPEPSPVG